MTNFNTELLNARAVHFQSLGSGASEAVQLFRTAVETLLETPVMNEEFWAHVNQGIYIIKHHAKAFPELMAKVAQFPFILGAKLPRDLIMHPDRMIVDAKFFNDDLTFSDEYVEFTYWMIQQLAHFRSDSDNKGSYMIGQEESVLKNLKQRVIRPEKNQDETNDDFTAQVILNRLMLSDVARLISALTVAATYTDTKRETVLAEGELDILKTCVFKKIPQVQNPPLDLSTLAGQQEKDRRTQERIERVNDSWAVVWDNFVTEDARDKKPQT